MLHTAEAVFCKSKNQKITGNRILVDQLLLILSDGRGVFAGGSTVRTHFRTSISLNTCSLCTMFYLLQPVQVAIRKLNEMGVLCVFIILDSPSKVRIVSSHIII